MGKEVRFIVVWNEDTNSLHIDEDMAEMVFNGDDVWNVDDCEWEQFDGDDNGKLYRLGLSVLRERLGVV
jgi:hypothetical protein